MTFELENKVPSIHPKATNWLDNNNSNFNFNLTKASSLVNSGWGKNYGNQLLDSNLLDPIKNPKIKSSDLIDIGNIRIPEINLTQPLEIENDLIQPINPDAAVSTDIADRLINNRDARMENLWSTIRGGMSGHNNEHDDIHVHVGQETTIWHDGGSLFTITTEGEDTYTTETDPNGENTYWRNGEEISEEDHAYGDPTEGQIEGARSNLGSHAGGEDEGEGGWWDSFWDWVTGNNITPYPGLEDPGRTPWWTTANAYNLDSLINQVDPHLASEYLLEEVVTTSLENRIVDNLLLQGNNTSAQIEGTDELTNFDKGLLANKVTTNFEHAQDFGEPIAADHDVFSFGGITQSMPLSSSDENVLLTVDNVMPQQMLSNNMTTPIEF
ncbi:hypothetical [Prochlorococcus marinus str. MIT 9313]|uniref:Uncharacterized protein n=2 Tax=Prochlorococcus marinus TaxID=1219 RepID=Q7V6E2_PROMM|nr:hypothetical [Prochlorococcus marinus str. MIT 9313]